MTLSPSPRTILWINRNFRMLIGIVSVMLVILGFFLFLYRPLQQILKVEVSSVKTLKEQRQERERKLAAVREFVQRYRGVSATDTERLERILPTEAQVPLLFDQIPALVADSGLQLDSITFSSGTPATIGATSSGSAASPAANSNRGTNSTNSSTNANTSATPVTPPPPPVTVAGKTLQIVTATLNVSGGQTYDDLKRFLDAMEKNLRVFDVTQVSFSTDPKLTPAGDSNASAIPSVDILAYAVTIQTYYFQP